MEIIWNPPPPPPLVKTQLLFLYAEPPSYDVKSNLANPSVTTGFICPFQPCVAIQMYNCCFVPFVPCAVYLQPGFCTQPGLCSPGRSTTKTHHVKPARLFVPSRFHHNLNQGERQRPPGSHGGAGGHQSWGWLTINATS